MDNPCYKNDRQPKTSERRRRFGITGYNYHCVCPSGNALKKNCQHPFENDPSARREWLGEPEWGGGCQSRFFTALGPYLVGLKVAVGLVEHSTKIV